jgi:mannose-6-phosphate isomerase-like protein (cupin superfamily)
MPEVRFLLDPHREFIERDGIPIVESFGIDLLRVETAPWPRLGVPGAVVHLDARGDFCNLYLCDLPPGGATEPQRHLFEEVMYVLEGSGSTTLELPGGDKRSFEWGRGSLFALPVNMRYRLYNGSGLRPARVAAVTNLPMVMKLYRNERFVFDTPFDFVERLGDEQFLQGGGAFLETREHRHMWETNFVPNLLSFEHMRLSPGRGRGSANIMFILADSTMHAHMSEIPSGDYKKAHRHGEGYHIFQLSGAGYSLYWNTGEEPRRVDWTYGLLHSPPDQMWHQHFNVSEQPARYLAVNFGSQRYPFTREKRATIDRTYTVKSDFQIDYEDEDPAIRRLFDAERERFRAGQWQPGPVRAA